MLRVFISYRRSDTQDITQGIYQSLWGELKEEYGDDVIFLDTSGAGGIPAGKNFDDEIITALFKADVILVIIGEEWATVTKPGATQARIWDTEDWVHKEVERALDRRTAGEIEIVPVLINGTSMPTEQQLPPALRGLAKIQAERVERGSRFTRDMQALTAVVKAHLRHFDNKKPTRPGMPRFVWALILLALFVVAAFIVLQSDLFASEVEPTATATERRIANATVLPSDTPTEVQSASETPTAIPTEPRFTNGRELHLEYNGSSFYVHNRSTSIVASEDLDFIALDNTGNRVSSFAFGGERWAQQYPAINPGRCTALEIISPSVPYLEPTYCVAASNDSIYHALSKPAPGSALIFWVARGNITQFSVRWNNFEAGRCQAVAPDDELSCEILVGN